MAEIASSSAAVAEPVIPPSSSPAPSKHLQAKDRANGKPQQRRRPANEIYVLPAPIKTFPLPSFYPNNPISVFHILYQWMSHTIWPPREPSIIHLGVWSPDTRSVHVLDPASIRALWEQGFYGKGSLSRSEPEWRMREEVRRGLREGTVSDLVTHGRREERRQMKWERARSEQEAIWQQISAEAQEAVEKAEPISLHDPVHADGTSSYPSPPQSPETYRPQAPVGPLELLSLPNSEMDLSKQTLIYGSNEHALAVTNGTTAITEMSHSNGHATTSKASASGVINGIVKNRDRSTTASSEASDEPAPLKRQKSVRFSPKVESTTFLLSDPPSPRHALLSAKEPNGQTSESSSPPPPKRDGIAMPNKAESGRDHVAAIVDKEHLQLMPEEAFFLVFAMGVLNVIDPVTKSLLGTAEVFDLFRRYSYFPPRTGFSSDVALGLSPDDPFLVHYAVYHHYRSLGWVPRPGLKFGVDWLIYLRGPVFDHAQFGIVVLPSYSDPAWKEVGKQGRERSWYEFHGTSRVIAHVRKNLLLAYVDVPPPAVFEEALADGGVGAVFRAYKVREVMVQRWSSNRNR